MCAVLPTAVEPAQMGSLTSCGAGAAQVLTAICAGMDWFSATDGAVWNRASFKALIHGYSSLLSVEQRIPWPTS